MSCDHCLGYRCDHLSVCASPGGCVNGHCDKNNNCQCLPGFNGTACDSMINNCGPISPCLNNGRCYNLVNNYTCSCPVYYTGRNCTVDTRIAVRATDIPNPCINSPCLNGGTCVHTSNQTYVCKCQSQYMLDDCSVHRLQVIGASPSSIKSYEQPVVTISAWRVDDDSLNRARLYIQNVETEYFFVQPLGIFDSHKYIHIIIILLGFVYR